MKYLILGAGPAGLSFAASLLLNGEDSFTILEANASAGGLCRSVMVDGAPLDIGGGHFLDTKRPLVNKFLFKFMPEDEWNLYTRDSRIEIFGSYINHPFEANIWQLDTNKQKEYLESIAGAGCNTGKKMPDTFIEWINWKLGDKIAEDYMLPYNRKMFGDDLNALGIYWLNKLPNVSYEETLLSCKEHRAYGSEPGHAMFYYPKKYGYGELWLRMAAALGDRLEYNKTVCSIDFDKHIVKTADGTSYKADAIITTIPWLELDELFGMPEDIKNSIMELKHSSVQIGYYPEDRNTPAQWIYCPDPKLSYHRLLIRSNFINNARGYWSETNASRLSLETDKPYYKYLNKYAYPLNTKNKPEIMKRLLEFSEAKNVYGLGRWGEHSHYNSDVVVELSMQLAQRLTRK